MLRTQPVRYLSKFPNFCKLALGVVLLLLFLGYQPVLAFPPIKANPGSVYAEQTQEIKAQDLGFSFQLPHPGYLSTKYSSYHPGIDIATGLGMPVKAIARGKVISSGFSFWGLGLFVEVEHPSGYRSTYAHLGQIYVKNDQEIDENTYIGEVGMTGNTSGPHTHLEITREGVKIDPLAILPKIRDYPQESDFKAAGGTRQFVPQKPPTPSPTPDPEKVKELVKEQKAEEIKNIISPFKPATPQSLSPKSFLGL